MLLGTVLYKYILPYSVFEVGNVYCTLENIQYGGGYYVRNFTVFGPPDVSYIAVIG
jgi:hypothetical protein